MSRLRKMTPEQRKSRKTKIVLKLIDAYRMTLALVPKGHRLRSGK